MTESPKTTRKNTFHKNTFESDLEGRAYEMALDMIVNLEGVTEGLLGALRRISNLDLEDGSVDQLLTIQTEATEAIDKAKEEN